MVATITFYDEDNFPFEGLVQTTVDDTLRDILYAWQDNGLAGSHPVTTGGFSGSVPPGGTAGFSGTSYTYGDGTTGISFEVTGQLYYYFSPLTGTVPGATNHTLYGSIDTITIGAGLDASGVTTEAITFTFDDPIVGALAEGRTNDVHDVIWGLMNGSVTGATDSLGTISTGGLIDRLEDNGIDVDDVFADIVGLSPFAESELLLAA